MRHILRRERFGFWGLRANAAPAESYSAAASVTRHLIGWHMCCNQLNDRQAHSCTVQAKPIVLQLEDAILSSPNRRQLSDESFGRQASSLCKRLCKPVCIRVVLRPLATPFLSGVLVSRDSEKMPRGCKAYSTTCSETDATLKGRAIAKETGVSRR